MTKRFAVIGNPIEHSLSPLIHQQFGQQTQIALTYEKIRGIDSEFENQVRHFFKSGGQGLNVTLPYKVSAFAMADVVTQRCKLAGAANTLWVKDQQLYADNTDGVGLIRDLNRYLSLCDKAILILGAGGAVRGIINPLLESKPSTLTVANRSLEKITALRNDFPELQYRTLESLLGEFGLIINATSANLSSHPLILSEKLLEVRPFCYDLAYHVQNDTQFIQYAKENKCEAVDGLGMLVEQAAEAFYIWNGILPSTKEILNSIQKKS